MLSSEMRACGILHQDQPKRKLRTAIENTPSGQLLIANNAPLNSITRGQRLTFTPVEDYYTGRQDATSGIMFGNMSTNDIEIPVAIKPHDNITSALSEFCITQHLISEGHIKPYQPLGFLSGRDSIYTLSAFEDDVVSCDAITDSTDNPKKIQKVPLVGAATLAMLHKSGVAHGDAQIKNTAFSVKTGEERAIDLTSSYFDKSGRGIIDDMPSYIDTLPDYISPVLDDEHVKEYFIDPYLSLVAGALSKKQQDSVHRVTNNL